MTISYCISLTLYIQAVLNSAVSYLMAGVFSDSSRLLDSTSTFKLVKRKGVLMQKHIFWERQWFYFVFSSKTSPYLWLAMKATDRVYFAKNVSTTDNQRYHSVLHLYHFHRHHCCCLFVLCISGLLDMLPFWCTA